jgi:hypothetical protein
MRKMYAILAVTGWLAGFQACATELDRMEKPTSTWTGPVFVPSFAFPSTSPAAEARPWEAIGFQKDPQRYLAAILAYVLEGQDVNTWRVQDNPVRKWYHVPWMGPGGRGREYVHGLTDEKESAPFVFGSRQKDCKQNWAVGFYNPVGGYTLGRIWGPVRDGTGSPDLSALPFPVGTVVAKLLYTEANAQDLDRLVGGISIDANIVKPDQATPAGQCSPPATPNLPGKPSVPTARGIGKLNLLQLDVAVRDPGANSTTGWVFGSFVFDGRIPGSDPWKKLAPIGLTWGNDPDLTDQAAAAGGAPSQSIVFSTFDFPRPDGFGRHNRMNGPIDNPSSACLSCHMTAQWPNPAALFPPNTASSSDAACWFRNLGPTMPFNRAPAAGIVCGSQFPTGPLAALDFSLQLVVAMRNWTTLYGVAALGTALAATPPDEILLIRGVESLPIQR